MPRELRPNRNLLAGDRLRFARLAFGFAGEGAQKQFAAEADLKANRYNQWEMGERFPPASALVDLCNKYKGLTMDWVYLGKMDGMPHWLTKSLDAVMDESDKTRLIDVSSRPTAAPMLALPAPPAPVAKPKFVKVPAAKRRRA